MTLYVFPYTFSLTYFKKNTNTMTQTSLPNGPLMSEVEVSSMAEHVNTKKKKTSESTKLARTVSTPCRRSEK